MSLPPRVIATPDELSALLSFRAKAHVRIGELAVAAALVSPEVVEAALAAQRVGGKGRLGDILVGMGVARRSDLDEVVERQTGLPIIDLLHYPVSQSAILALPAAAAALYGVLPVERVGSTLVVAFPVKPADDQLAAVRFAAGLPVVAFQASSPALLQSLVARHYADTSATFVKNALLDKGRYAKATADVQTPAGFFRYLVALAIGNGASDIHLRPYPDGSCKVLLRVDGLFRPVRDVTAKDVQALVRHIEALSGLDFFNRVSAKEGRLSIEYETRQVDLRVSVIGGASGDSVVLRVLDPLRFPASLEQLALPKPQLRALGGVLMRPHGMLVATGPTGSGKTTTLYTLLKELHARGLHVVTAEDPVEYRLAGINQFEGSDFSALLPKLLRHDPDVLMVGELRDEATVRMALNAALTGHLVLSTVHANDSASTVHRLLGLGAPMHILASCLTGILSQRLVRLLCVSCAGAGCQACGGTGFLGRTLAAELAKPRRSLAGFEGTPSYVDMVSHLDYLGGVTLDGSIVDLAKSGRTSWVEAASLISDPALLPHAMRIDLGYDDPVSEGGPPVP